jgi:hypothetical protein
MRSLFVLTAAAGSAYVFGAKAGRARYEEIRERWDSMRERVRQDPGAGSVKASDIEPPNVAPDAVIDR